LPATVKFADADVPEPASFAVPRTAPPSVNETLPVGSESPPDGFTTTLSEVVPPEAIVAGLAVTARAVATTGAATMTVAGDETEEAKAADPP
jgi:hypothetical protein